MDCARALDELLCSEPAHRCCIFSNVVSEMAHDRVICRVRAHIGRRTMPLMPEPDIAQLCVFEDSPTRVVCMDEYLCLLASQVVDDVPIRSAAEVAEWDGEIPISIEGETAA